MKRATAKKAHDLMNELSQLLYLQTMTANERLHTWWLKFRDGSEFEITKTLRAELLQAIENSVSKLEEEIAQLTDDAE